MEFNKKNVILYIILGIIILAIVFAVNYSKDKSDGKIGNSSTTTQIIAVTEQNKFFSVNSIVNNFFSEYLENDYDIVIDKMDSTYVLENKITKDNLKKYIIYDYDEINFYSKNIYLKESKNISYYFVNGEIHGYNRTSEILEEKKDVYTLVIVDNYNRTYAVTPIFSNLTIENYAKDYLVSDSNKIVYNGNNRYYRNNFKDEYISKYYINYFKNILYLNREKAYSMLSQKYKKTFTNYQNFVSKIDNLDKELNFLHYSYNFSETEENKIYKIVTYNKKEIEITETAPMNFTISIFESGD